MLLFISTGSGEDVTILLRQPQHEWKFDPLPNLEDTRVTSFAWSPLSSTPSITEPHKRTTLSLCTVGVDRKLRYFYQNFNPVPVEDDRRVVVLSGHTDDINACTFIYEPYPHLLASVSDDCSCKIWDLNAERELDTFPLSSPGLAIRSRAQNPSQLMIAEEKGKVKLVDLRSHRVVVTFHCQQDCLMDADWSSELKFGAACGNSWYLWRIDDFPHYMYTCQETQQPNPSIFRFSPSHPNLFSVVYHNSSSFSVWNDLQNDETNLSISGKISSLSWFKDEPCLVLATENRLHFWQLNL
eukprot:TRINITY_DN6283_c0_g1_i4.p1 TRINITY_DN6283_c0_g1~~TRINITY_DN6283_c0_g1_i4.p1  ORF type:complete len:297 (+),score=48.09 TRINITY_DN6283_c0_g1_i4:215-1105(+)